jgi:signal transduction histidine kinase
MLLELAALEDDKLPCVRAPIALAAFVDHVVSPLGERIKAKGVRLKLSFDVQEFAADERLLRRALTNLVGNALEHVTEGGTVSVYVGDFGAGLRVAVDNDGPSVPPNLVPTLFTKYGRLSARREGYGLGLYFVKLASEAHGGHAFYESPAGGGARFGFTLARAPA